MSLPDLAWRLVLTVARRCLRLDVRGAPPARGPAVLAANHLDRVLDGVILGASVRRRVRFVAHRDLLARPGVAWLLRGGVGILVDDGFGTLEDAVAACERAARRGELVAMFPEGRALGGGEGFFRDGAAYVATRLACPIVPVRLARLARRAYRVTFGTPLAPPARGLRLDARRLTHAVQDAIRALA